MSVSSPEPALRLSLANEVVVSFPRQINPRNIIHCMLAAKPSTHAVSFIHLGHLLKKVFVGNLPSDATEISVRALFAAFGKVHSVELITDMFSGKCRGFGYVGMEGHEARVAIANLNGNQFGGNLLKVSFENGTGRHGRRR